MLESTVYLVRHGRIPNHRADHPLTVAGSQEAVAVGQQLAAQIQPDEIIGFFASPARRTRQTAACLQQGIAMELNRSNVTAMLKPLVVVDPLQNMQLYLEGLSYDPVRPLFAAARWLFQEQPASPQHKASVAFQDRFWRASDPPGFWLDCPSSAAEAPESVAQRTKQYIDERLRGRGHHICVTHSANLRAFLRLIFGSDPGEPDYCAVVTVHKDQVCYQNQVGNFQR